MLDSQAGKMRGRTWRAGRSDLRLHAVSVFSLAIAFVCLAASLLVVSNIAAVRDRWSRAGRATVYLRDGATEAEVAALTSALQATRGVKRVRVITSAEARREIVTDEQDKVLAGLPPSAFPASLEVGFNDDINEDALLATTLKLRALPAVDTVETYQRWTSRLSALLGSGVAASLCLAVIVLGAVVSVIWSTSRHLLDRRRTEVEVLKLVGATNAFVRRPFVIEGAMLGSAGAAAAIVILACLFLLARSGFDQELSAMLGITPSFLPWYIALGMVALGGSLGASTAHVSLRKMVRI